MWGGVLELARCSEAGQISVRVCSLHSHQGAVSAPRLDRTCSLPLVLGLGMQTGSGRVLEDLAY